MELEDLHEKLLSQAILFEIPQPEPNILLSTKKSLKVNKQLWDFVHMVKSWIDLWQSTLWKDIDFELMDMELKRFAKELKGIIRIKIIPNIPDLFINYCNWYLLDKLKFFNQFLLNFQLGNSL